MGLEEALRAPILTQGSVFEQLRRTHPDAFDPDIGPAGMLYDDEAAELLAEQHRTYMKVAQQAGLPMLSMASTCLLYTSPSPRDLSTSRMPSSA